MNEASARFTSPQHGQAIRLVFTHANYTDEAVLGLMGGTDVSSITATDPAEQLYRTRGRTPLEVLTRLFLISAPVDLDDVQGAVRPSSPQDWFDAGLIKKDPQTGLIIGTVNILPFQGLLLMYDTRSCLAAGREDFVMGLGKSSLTLANLTVRRPSRRTLDLGTGGGIQGLLAARHSQKVIATDRNPRAVQFAAFNAQLNEMPHMQAREGNLFEPVDGELFDLVVTNPPFVISPESQYIYRDSGLKGDEVCQTIVHNVGGFLEEGGYCVMLCNWSHLKDQDWTQRLEGWAQGTGCDALVLRSETTGADVYATTWIKHTELADPQHFERRLDQWLAYYAQQGIEQISAGVVILRKRTGATPNWFETQDTPKTMLGPCGDDVIRRFEARDFLDTVTDDAALLASVLRIDPDTRLTHHCKPADDDGWAIVDMQLSRSNGFVYHDKLDTVMAHFLGQCTGQQPLSRLIEATAGGLNQPPEEFAKQVLPIIRQLIRRGVLEPVDS